MQAPFLFSCYLYRHKKKRIEDAQFFSGIIKIN